MKYFGQIRELTHQHEIPVQYFLQIDEAIVHLNQWIGNKIKLTFLNEIYCIHCGRKIKKTFNNGSCYPCFKALPQNDLCIVKPNLCHFDKGTCRDEEFGKDKCMIPHYVYLALSSDVKVGLTRKTNAFKRWVDQGAVQAIPIAELPTRKIAGDLEAYLSQFMKDKTNWRKMLKEDIEERDLLQIRKDVLEIIPEEYKDYLLGQEEINRFVYPYENPLEKITSINLDKETEVNGILIGIKGQYLILDTGVINIKKHSGYKIELKIVGSA